MRLPVFMLAIDHRWQWEDWCQSSGVSRERIPEFKNLAAEAYLQARAGSATVQTSGALLVDLTYGREAFEAARAAGVRVGTPAERAGAFPLEWTAAFDTALPGDFVKVLVRHRRELSTAVVERQREHLLELQSWCAAARKPLVVEVLVSPDTGADSSAVFDAVDRPALLAGYIRDSYAASLVPQFWKIEGMPDVGAQSTVDAAIREIEGPQQLILGKGAGLEQVRQWFGSAAGASTAAGFAIGRTVYERPVIEWATGRCSRTEALRRITQTYEWVIDAWRETARTPLSR